MSQSENPSDSMLMLADTPCEEENDKEDDRVQETDCGSLPRSPPPSYQHALKSHEESERSETLSSQPDSKVSNNGDATQVKRPEIFHKSSKEFYKAVAAQWGITCKMSDHCRCIECQSRYFDCEYDRDNELEKTDGGLAAGTPMFISEVMHGSVCRIL